MAEEKIKGISEFCDEWCERCAFTARCAVYVEGSKSLREKQDLPPMFAARMRANIGKAMQLFGKLSAGEPGKVDVDEGREADDLTSLSERYAQMSQDWLKSQPGMMDRLQELITELTIGMESVDSIRGKTESIKSSLALIQWNARIIQSKISDALFLIKIGDEQFVGETYSGLRSNGLLKTVLIAIDQSINAWKIIFELLPDREDDFLRILAGLQKIQHGIVKQFPEAENFKRPGFDD